MLIHMGLDVGSTTVKLVILDEKLNILYQTYRRHFSDVRKTVRDVINEVYDDFKYDTVTVNVTGSGGLSVHQFLDIDFIQEVVAGREAISCFIPQTDVAIELGGEDSKITYLRGSVEQRMNSICAGGTGAFIDQMASLLQTDASGLNEMAKGYEKLYPIASRCGVFAKTDVQALINQGASKSDIAVSVFQSVVNQTISNLACGRPIRGKVAFLGGPLHFLPMLKERFVETLDLGEDEIIAPENSQIFVALGAALSSFDSKPISFVELFKRVNAKKDINIKENDVMPPLFKSDEEVNFFREKHKTKSLKKVDLKDYEGPIYLGIDSGSTTSKLVAITDKNEILYSFYGSNKGNPLDIAIENLKEIYKEKNSKSYFAGCGTTGYGEEFLKAALNLDFGEVETIAHFTAAKYFDPEVDFILDIGGQDMKSMKIRDGVIESILLNEACSAGCGSFLETFARSVNMSAKEFANEATKSRAPVDLGSRCTVFMNSNVKQAQKEGASVPDISAGLAYSVIRNAIQKVIKVRDPKELGNHIVVQGGTFLSDAVLRAFENLTDVEVTRPDIAGLMGALGMALIAKEKSSGKSSIISEKELENFEYKSISTNCRQCTNNCALSVNVFPNGKRYITGNRCEKGAGHVKSKEDELSNMYRYKYERVFDYKSLPEKEAKRGVVGIPRVLNIYENYPFWHTFLTELGYSVVLSGKSSREVYEKGIETITSETACYPAKITHGHIEDLIEKGIDFIFYPAVFYEEKQFKNADNTLNCPVVAGYSEVIKNNVDDIIDGKVKFMNPFISFDNRKKLEKRLSNVFDFIPSNEVKKAVRRAYEEQDRYRLDVLNEGNRILEEVKNKNQRAIVLSGRPYHIDPEINHGIPELINSLGLAVISEDAIARNVEIDSRLRVLDQWNYHSRLYRAAKFVGEHENLELVQLNSFGCGIDAVTTDQVQHILEAYNKIYTVLKIDEVSNLGSVKIRIRSLIEAAEKREFEKIDAELEGLLDDDPVMFTKEMKENYTILMPQMAPLHFSVFEPIMRQEGINVEVLKDSGHKVVNEGLKYVNNDACYPSIFVVGQFIDAVKSGEYDTDHLALLMSQTGGACRASNYVGFIRKALKDAGYGHVPVIGLSFQQIEKHSGFEFEKKQLARMGKKMVQGMLYADLIMKLTQATRPYEVIKGSSNILRDRWIDIVTSENLNYSKKSFIDNVNKMVSEFNRLEITNEKKPKVGIVGEILVKYDPAANNYVADLLEKEGAEVVIPDFTDFMMYSFKNARAKSEELSKSKLTAFICEMGIYYVESYRKYIREALEPTRFDAPEKIEEIIDYAKKYVDLGNQYGEGWLLTGEMVELIESGVENIICVQPFGCLPNHITGKGVIKALRNSYEKANIIPIDYDASASEVNQFNRIKLMLSQARKNMEEGNSKYEKGYLKKAASVKN
ncbi:2-hydroxyacyl-CoA dehydratase [Peptoniphilus rhinitidis]|uniref:2-hydroxyacyl-CoA dehydratase n=2 Tax=Peptoniphilus rhinitidis TaxID=1175452 RepID=UPI00028866F6|nr:2-hydroxyacyl-CoA dehydratase [Peptoniphilus rhinitidis]MDU1043330.1 acyl-CoA dehydratase activase-related protein [Peptoniphilus rhinitidis]MDU2109543.1 acyl-CoA dehydratase activase-related protein [Peptoniphilus lacydonensis]